MCSHGCLGVTDQAEAGLEACSYSCLGVTYQAETGLEACSHSCFGVTDLTERNRTEGVFTQLS